MRYIENHGYEPSYQLIARQMGLRSKAGIAKHVQALEEQGFLRRVRENGSFRLQIGRGETTPGYGEEIDWLETPAEDGEAEKWELLPFFVPEFMLGDLTPSEVFAYRVRDDAMQDKNICEGDIAIVERRSHARDGDCVVALIKKKGYAMRNFYRDGAHVELCPANKNYEVIRIAANLVEIQGKFRTLMRPAG